jgi:hypothetical protein
MNRLISVSALFIVATAGAYAGSVTLSPVTVNLGTQKSQAGGGSILNSNLATNILPCMTNCTASAPSNTVSQTPSSGAVGFTSVLFSGTQVPFNIGGSYGGGNASGADVFSPGSITSVVTRTVDVGNYTGSGAPSNTSGALDPDQIWTMINDLYGAAGYQGVTLVLSGESLSGTAITETINLEDGIDYRSIGYNGGGADLSSSIQYAVPCDIANIGSATLGTNCSGATSPTTAGSATDSRSGLSATAGVSVTVYNDVFQTSDTFGNNYWLDVQDINLGGAFNNAFLNTIEIESNGSSSKSEQVVLSAITVDSAAPEPGTIVLFGTGLAGLVVLQRRRSKKA